MAPVAPGALGGCDVELIGESVSLLDQGGHPCVDGGFFRDTIIYFLIVDWDNGGKKCKSVPVGGPLGAPISRLYSHAHRAQPTPGASILRAASP